MDKSEGVAKYFNSLQGWRIELLNTQEIKEDTLPEVPPMSLVKGEEEDDLPF